MELIECSDEWSYSMTIAPYIVLHAFINTDGRKKDSLIQLTLIED